MKRKERPVTSGNAPARRARCHLCHGTSDRGAPTAHASAACADAERNRAKRPPAARGGGTHGERKRMAGGVCRSRTRRKEAVR